MNDLLSDLQADLAPAVPAQPTAPGAAIPRTSLPLPTAPLRRTTPAFELRVTPLRWALPGLALDGIIGVQCGPVRIGLPRR